MLKRTSLLALILISLSGSFCIYSQNQKIDGYKGLWFCYGQPLEYGYKFSGGAATFASQHRPVAIFSPEVRKTFFVYGGTYSSDERHLLIMISYFDHSHHVVPKPVIVYDKMGVREPYDNPALSIDSEGYLWVFVSGRVRTRPGLIFKSSQPYSIESFEKIIEKEMISPQPWHIKDHGFLLMFSKATSGQELYFCSSPDGKIWNESQKIAGMGGHNKISEVSGNKLMTVFNYWPGGNLDKRTNLYLLQTEDMGRTWKTIGNKIIDIPVTETNNEALVKNYEAEGKIVYLSDLNIDKDGNPVLLIILGRDSNPGPNGGPREWMVVHRKDQKWNFSKVCESDHNYDMGSLYITDEEWLIIGPTEPGPQKYGTGGEIALWISKDEGISWEKSHDLTTNSKFNNSFVRRPINAHKDFYFFWTDGDADKLSSSRLYYTDQKCKRVWIMPYDMIADSEKPVRLR